MCLLGVNTLDKQQMDAGRCMQADGKHTAAGQSTVPTVSTH